MSLVKAITHGFFWFFIVISSTAHARSAVPVVNHDNVPVAVSSGKDITLDRIRQAFIVGGARNGWTFTESGPNQLTGTLVVRNKHTVSVTINYNSKSYSVEYKDSSNMKYGQKDGIAVIHPFYNTWVDALISEVALELSRIQ